jgi:RHS repeat-associated protein
VGWVNQFHQGHTQTPHSLCFFLQEKIVTSVSTDSKQREVGYLGKQVFELSNHLGNVLATITDKKLQVSLNTTSTAYFEADVQTVQDYYAFGMEMPGRKLSGGYRYGFNGKENDNEVKGEGNQQDYGMRIYDGRIGKFLSVDPLTLKYPFWTPYQFAGNMPIKYIDLDGLEPANNPTDTANQDGRNPTKTINKIFEQSGGQKNYERNFTNYMKGTYDASAKTSAGISDKPGYTSDSKGGADKGNLWVNNTGVFKAENYANFNTIDFTNFLLGNLINGTGPENIEFPLNGTVSNYMKGSGIVNDAMASWYALNQGRSELVGGEAEFSGNKHNAQSFIFNGMFHPETMVGSATVLIMPISSKEVIVQVFNVTSLTSGDFEKHLPWNKYPKSVVRDPSKTSSSGANKYGNISQLYQFTMPIDASQFKK